MDLIIIIITIICDCNQTHNIITFGSHFKEHICENWIRNQHYAHFENRARIRTHALFRFVSFRSFHSSPSSDKNEFFINLHIYTGFDSTVPAVFGRSCVFVVSKNRTERICICGDWTQDSLHSISLKITHSDFRRKSEYSKINHPLCVCV